MADIRPYLRKCAVKRLQGPLTADARSQCIASCTAALQAGATTLAIDPGFQSGSMRPWAPLLREIFNLCHAEGVLSMVIDDVLMLMQTGARAVCLSRCHPSYARVREVAGPQVFLGRAFADQADLQEVKASGRFDHLDFCAAGRWETSATEAILDRPSHIANLAALRNLFGNRPSLLLQESPEDPCASRPQPHWDGTLLLLRDEGCQTHTDTELARPSKPHLKTALASPQPSSVARQNHGCAGQS